MYCYDCSIWDDAHIACGFPPNSLFLTFVPRPRYGIDVHIARAVEVLGLVNTPSDWLKLSGGDGCAHRPGVVVFDFLLFAAGFCVWTNVGQY